MTRLEEFLINRRAWVTVDHVALRFLCSRTRVYKAINALMGENRLEIRARGRGKGFEYRGKEVAGGQGPVHTASNTQGPSKPCA
jgi:predicted transcriptional regulator